MVFRAKSSKAYTEAREKVSAVNADLQENVAGLRVAQAYRREDRNRARFAGLSDAYRQSRLRAQRYIALYFPFMQSLSTIAGALVLLVAAGQMRSGALTAGALIAYLLYIDMLFSPVQQLSQVFDGYQQAAVGLRRIQDLLRTPTSTPQAASSRARRSTGPAAGSSSATCTSATAADGEALAGVNLTVAPGETVALVGQTGAGKSTLVKLVARFYDVTAGSVLVDGVDVRDYDLASYRQTARRGPAGGPPVRRHRTRRDRLRQAGGHRRRGRGGRPGGGRDRHDRAAARRLQPRGSRARAEPLGRPAPADRAGAGLPGRSRHPAPRRGDRRA